MSESKHKKLPLTWRIMERRSDPMNDAVLIARTWSEEDAQMIADTFTEQYPKSAFYVEG